MSILKFKKAPKYRPKLKLKKGLSRKTKKRDEIRKSYSQHFRKTRTWR